MKTTVKEIDTSRTGFWDYNDLMTVLYIYFENNGINAQHLVQFSIDWCKEETDTDVSLDLGIIMSDIHLLFLRLLLRCLYHNMTIYERF